MFREYYDENAIDINEKKKMKLVLLRCILLVVGAKKPFWN